MIRNVPQIALGTILLGGLLGLSGCFGEKQFDVSGKVTYQGSPIDKPGGQISFVGPKGNQVIASINADGTYHAVKVFAGANKVAVYYPNPAAKAGRRFPTPLKPGESPAPPAPLPPAFITPQSYASIETSGLSVEVANGTVFNVDLKAPSTP